MGNPGRARPPEETPNLNHRPIDTAWAWLPVLLGTAAALAASMGSIDLAYHVRAGGDIVRSASIPAVDTYTFSASGAPWLDQQWAAQVLLHLIHRLGGWAALKATQGLLAGASFGLVYLACRAKGAPVRDASLLTLAGFLVGFPTLVARPQLLAIPLVATALWAIASRAPHPGRLWLLPLLAAACANIHGSFIIIPALGALAWLEDAVTRSGAARRTAAVTAVAALGTLINPQGVEVWSYVASIPTDQIVRSSVKEWAPLSLSTIPGSTALMSAFVAVAYLMRRRVQVHWTSLVGLGVFFLTAMLALRGVVWWAMVAPVLLAGPKAGPAGCNDIPQDRGSTLPARAVIGALVILIVALLPWWKGPGYEQHLVDVPPGITEAVRSLPPGSRLFAHQPWGSWFEFETPDKPVFVDSRIEIYPAEVWEDYGQVAFAGAGWREVLERWQPDAIVAATEWELIPYLREEPGWDVAYEDEDGVLFVREP